MDAIFDQGPRAPCPAPFNMAGYVLAQADAHSDKIALSVVSANAREDWTFSQLKSAILGTATGLLKAGLVPGNRLLLRLGNCIDFPVAYLGAIAAGIIPVPTSTQLTVPEISTIAAGLCPDMILAGTDVALPAPLNCPVISQNNLRQMRELPAATVDLDDPDRAAYIIYTSGTGGKSRGVVHAHRAIWARRMMWDGWYGLNAEDRLMHAGAFNWTYTLGTGLLDPWAIGATALIPAADVKPADIPALLAQEKASIFAAAPGVFRQMLKSPFPPLPYLRHALSAGEKMPDHTRKHWNQVTVCKIYEAFGMSECSTFISGSPARPAPAGTTGFAQPGRRVAILTESGHSETGQPGVIAISADDPGLMLGYLNDPGTTRAKFRDGWFLTGDNGVMDEVGAITYLGRDDDMMNAGGFRVSPLEVENAMRAHPDITDCAAVEAAVKADATVIAVFFQSDIAISDIDLTAHAQAVLARYKQPRMFQRIDTLPHGANGKLLRRELRDRLMPE